MPRLFAYRARQQDQVPRSIAGRPEGSTDELVGFEVPRASGPTPRAGVTFTGRAESRVAGTLLEVTDGELAAADRAEASADVERVSVKLASETPAWVYVHSGFAASVYAALARLGADPERAVYLKAGAGDAAIASLQRDARARLGGEVPESFVRLLRLSNGAQINGAFFKQAENLVLENLDVPRRGVIVLGNAGNVDEYVFDARDRHFHVTTFGFEGERVASFRTFEELLVRVFQDQGEIS